MSEGNKTSSVEIGRINMGDEGESEAQLPPVDEVQRCLRRFAGFRSAQRALAPSVAELREESAQVDGQRLREQLENLAGQWKALDALDRPDPVKVEDVCAGFATVDEELSTLCDELRQYADDVHPVQMRSTLPEIARRHRREVCALLDLLIEDPQGLNRRRTTIEYLITLLATDDESGSRKISHDPVRLTPSMQALCERVESESSAMSEQYELDFFEAANVDDSVDVFARVRKMRDKKEELGSACFLPGVLRAIVTYNARMANQMISAVTTARMDDLSFEGLVDGDQSLVNETQDESELDFVEPDLAAQKVEAVPIRGVNGIDQIFEAIRRKIRSVPIGSCASERVAMALDLSALNDDELAMFGSVDDDEDSRTTASVLLVGLLNAVYPAIEVHLEGLGITRQSLAEDWPKELDQDLQTRISALLASNEYEPACQLSEFKTKHLYASLSSLAREKRDRDGIRPVQEHPEESSAKSQMVAFAKAAKAELTGFRKGDWVGPVSMIVYGKGTTGGQIRSALASLVAVGLFMAIGLNTIRTEETEVVVLPPRDLSNISHYLKSAYRNDQGRGTLVIGQVDREWSELSHEERLEVADDMRREFEVENIRDAMIYDDQRRLQIYLASGSIRKPLPVPIEFKTQKRVTTGRSR
jgi:hypothetical protein